MEVTRHNFQKALKELDKDLEDATFLAIDGEFTGLNSGPDASAFDTPAEYYDKLRKGSMNFLLVQFGLSVFSYNTETDKYRQKSYNFYVFPKPYDRSSPDCRFLCQASSMDFLANQGFDFNKLFLHGIPYLTRADEEELNKKIQSKQKVREEGLEHVPIPDNERIQIEEFCKSIDKFIKSESKELILNRTNAFIRRLLYQEVRARWPDKIRLELKNENNRQLFVAYKMGSKQEEEELKAKKREEERLEIQNAVGMSALLRKISASGKVVVGHNMLLDLCHVVKQFFAPLPENYLEFKSLIHNLFPKLMDTKILAQLPELHESLNTSILDQLFEKLQSPPFSIPQTENVEGCSYTLSNDKFHEAGYDAYITGLCFIAMSNALGSLKHPKVNPVLADSEILARHLNKLLIARIRDYPYIHLTQDDPNPSRKHVFHVTFPKEWQPSDLSQLFFPYGGAYISWLTDTTAFAALYQHDQVSMIVQKLIAQKSTTYRLRKYEEYRKSLEPRKRKATDDDSPSEDGPAEQEKKQAAKATTTVVTVAAVPKENDGWEVASGNNTKKFPPRDNERARRRELLSASNPFRILEDVDDEGRLIAADEPSARRDRLPGGSGEDEAKRLAGAARKRDRRLAKSRAGRGADWAKVLALLVVLVALVCSFASPRIW